MSVGNQEVSVLFGLASGVIAGAMWLVSTDSAINGSIALGLRMLSRKSRDRSMPTTQPANALERHPATARLR